MLAYRGRTAASIKLRLLDIAVDSDALASVLGELGRSIRKCGERIAAARPDDDGVVDLECGMIEALLGTTYIICQVKITAVVEAAVELVGKTHHEIRAMGSRFNAEFSNIEVLWALGNYFKHRDEWELSEWDAPTGVRKFTIPAIMAAGLEASSSGNLRRGATALGNVKFSDIAVFQKIVDEWAADVVTAARSTNAGAFPAT